MDKKKQKSEEEETTKSSSANFFDLLSEELVFTILDFLDQSSLDRKSFSQVSRNFYSVEAKHRRCLRPLRTKNLAGTLSRFPALARVDLTLCPRVSDCCLAQIAASCASELRAVDLSRSRFFSGAGIRAVTVGCANLVEINLSNATELRDSAMAAIAEARNLERLWLARCKMITDLGVGCVAVGCPKLRLICLRWCLGVGDFGVGLVAVKCKEIRSLDLSFLPV